MAAARLDAAPPPPLPGGVLAAALLIVLAALPAAAQETPEAARPDSLGDVPARPLFLLFGEVRAESLRFHGSVPELEVRFFGNVADTAARAWTVGLPERVRPDTTYRDVRVYFQLYSAIGEVDRWSREAFEAPPDSLMAPPDDSPRRRP